MNHNDPPAQSKTYVWIRLVMALAGVIRFSSTAADSIRALPDNLYLIPLCVFYAIALFFGLLGAKHLDATVVSPPENIGGAMAAIMLYIFFLFTGCGEFPRPNPPSRAFTSFRGAVKMLLTPN